MKLLFFACLFFSLNLAAQESNIWTPMDENLSQRDGEGKDILPTDYSAFSLDVEQLRVSFKQLEQDRFIDIPQPNGSFITMKFEEISIMEESLQSAFPNIRTYKAVAIDNPFIFGTFDLTPKGFHGMVQTENGTFFIDPFSRENIEDYQVYYRKNLPRTKEIICSNDGHVIHGSINHEPSDNSRGTLTCNTSVLKRTYRLAVSCTGEYAGFHGGTAADALAAITTTINRVNQVYEIDFATRLILIANELDIIYTNAGSDPYNNNDPGVLINQSQSNITSVIGSANFDVGHTFSTGAGGLAGLGVICKNSQKAYGVTGTGSPVNDPYDIDYVAHELGHQFGSNHTFNGSSGSCSGGNRNGSTAYEPGSGTTIMAYAGICSPQNIQNNSDAYFHASSHDEILSYLINGTGSTCGTSVSAINTSPQIDTYTTGKTIPKSTAFYLEGSASDTDGDALTYCWEQYDLGPAGAPNDASSSTTQPLFRTFTPISSGVRYFPQLSDVLSDIQTMGEILPAVGRSMTFRLTVRDNGTNSSSQGGLCFQDNSITVDGTSGPFLMTNLNSTQLLMSGTTQTITWSVAGTNTAPVSCANVNILMSTDGGLSFGTTLASNTPNDGTQDIVVPTIESSEVRIKIECSDNIFFDINNDNLIISSNCQIFEQTADLNIPSNAANSVTSTLVVSGMSGSITDVDIIDLQGTHTYIQDLTFDLEHPNGTKRILFQNICGSQNDFNSKFDDGSALGNGDLPCPPTSGLTYQPLETFSAFNGLTPNGTWKLNINDNFASDGGDLDNWQMLVCTNAPLPLDLISFKAKLQEGNVKIDWHILNSIGVKKFELYRANSHKVSFDKIGDFMFSENEDEYSFLDRSLNGNEFYYKLKIINEDNSFEWSNVEVISIMKDFQVKVSPMPFSDQLTLNVLTKNIKSIDLFIYDISGKEVLVERYSSNEELHLDLGFLLPGVYTLKVKSDNYFDTKKIIKK